MIKHIVYFIGIGGLLIFWGQTLHAYFGGFNADEDIKQPVVVELFTSQSCSSCPPADRFLNELADHKDVIALGFHVTYWNHLHWKDTLSREFSTARQRAYNNALRTGRVYTPQMIINGHDEFVGSQRGRAGDVIRQTHDILPLSITRSGEQAFEVQLPKTKPGQYRLWLFGTKTAHQESIRAGENRGRTVSYAHAVLSELSLDAWQGQRLIRSVELPEDFEGDTLTILAQSADGYGDIIAAGRIARLP